MEWDFVPGLKYIGEASRKQGSLKEIHLILSGMNVTDEELFYFAEGLKQAEYLKKIYLDFNE